MVIASLPLRIPLSCSSSFRVLSISSCSAPDRFLSFLHCPRFLLFPRFFSWWSSLVSSFLIVFLRMLLLGFFPHASLFLLESSIFLHRFSFPFLVALSAPDPVLFSSSAIGVGFFSTFPWLRLGFPVLLMLLALWILLLRRLPVRSELLWSGGKVLLHSRIRLSLRLDILNWSAPSSGIVSLLRLRKLVVPLLFFLGFFFFSLTAAAAWCIFRAAFSVLRPASSSSNRSVLGPPPRFHFSTSDASSARLLLWPLLPRPALFRWRCRRGRGGVLLFGVGG